MNATKVNTLLKRWDLVLDIGETNSKAKAAKSKDGLTGRIKRSTGQSVIFDFEAYEDQIEIQNTLCQELPRWADIIRSKPEIMNGYHWTRNDFIELYFEHFKLVVEKIKRIVGQQNTV